MSVRKLVENVYEVGVRDWDRELFDELIPLPDGTSYNSYIIFGSEKTALIDSVEPAKKDIFLNNLKALNVKKIDYVISNHAEQDHSGSIPDILKMYPESRVVANEKCKNILKDHLLIEDEKFITIKDGDTLSLGDKTLKFIFAPWVHWPETMLTYLIEEEILFPCDLFGSHNASSSLFVKDERKTYYDAKRYYAEIMMPFRNNIVNHMKKIEALKLKYIAPSHGEVYKNPDFILNAYREWISDKVKNMVVLPYISMHHSTEVMVNFLIDKLIERGIEVRPFNLVNADIGEIAISLVDAATLIIGAPALLVGTHPTIIYAGYLVNALRPKVKFVSIIGSYGWGTKLVDQISGLITNFKPEIIPPVLAKGFPKEKDFNALEKLADTVAEKHKSINLI